MYQNLKIFRMAQAMATHAGTRQAVIARNMANADTPGYDARDITPFKDLVSHSRHADGLKATRAQHLNGVRPGEGGALVAAQKSETSPNGNGVSLELEMLKAVDVKRQHDRALAIYKSSLNILRASIGRR